eukprot:1496499-Amphidinium_carterae.1
MNNATTDNISHMTVRLGSSATTHAEVHKLSTREWAHNVLLQLPIKPMVGCANAKLQQTGLHKPNEKRTDCVELVG